MYFSLIETKQKGKETESRVLANPYWKEYSRSYRALEGDKIIRAPKTTAWKLFLNHSYRENGKVKKKQAYILTIHHWNVVDEYQRFLTAFNEDEVHPGWCCVSDDLSGYFDEKILHSFPDADLDEVWELFEKKIKPLEDAIIGEFKQSEEYQWWEINRAMKEEEKERKREEKRKEEARQEEERRQQYQYQQKSREEFYRSFNFDTASSSSSLSLSDEEANLLIRHFDVVYKQLAVKVHPDKIGGDTEKMKILNSLNERIKKVRQG